MTAPSVRKAGAGAGSRGEKWVAAFGEAALRRTGLYARLLLYMPQLSRLCFLAGGEEGDRDPAFLWASKTLASSTGAAAVTAAAWPLGADGAVLTVGAILTMAIPALSYREIAAKAKRRQESFVAELPTFMHKLSLLMGAGETVQRAWLKAGTVSGEKSLHPLYIELARTNNELTQAVPFQKALEELHRRCRIAELSSLVSTVLMNHKRGGEAFALVLQDTSRLLMERKQALIRTKGEEASTKIIVPMLFMLIAVMIVVAAPAVMMM
ncbi:type II secretion system F family protein [Paenibacillus sp. TRM 82003]|nr:type II secretion system F family protein [Paenibacillus sp. TRM 82003]